MVSVTFKPRYPDTNWTGCQADPTSSADCGEEQNFYPNKWPNLHLTIAQTVDFLNLK
jgi:hypothetical protein